MANIITITFPYQVSDQDSDPSSTLYPSSSPPLSDRPIMSAYKNEITDQNTVRKILETEYDFSKYGIKDAVLFLYAVREGIKCYKLDRGVAKYRKEGFRSRVFGGT